MLFVPNRRTGGKGKIRPYRMGAGPPKNEQNMRGGRHGRAARRV